MRPLPMLVVPFLFLALPAFAGDGVLEINQTCALNTGCFAGDAPGFPITIDGTAGRSYRLSSDLVVPNENTDGIVYSVDDVGIDLNGFSIRGPVVCSGTPLACVPAGGVGTGVKRTLNSNSGLTLENGSISGMGIRGVLAGFESELTHLRVRWSRTEGVSAGTGSVITHNTVFQNGGTGIGTSASTVTGNAVYQNGGVGISSGTGSTLSENTVHGNGLTGISAGTGSNVTDNVAYQNGSTGILVGSGSSASGNTTYQNDGSGISAGSGAVVSSNTAYLNGATGIVVGTGVTLSGNSAHSNALIGIQTNSGCTVVGNTARANTGFGFSLGADSGYRENVISSNAGGTITGAGLVNLGSNACDGSTVCP